VSDNINRQVAIGTLWMLLQRIVVRGIGLVSMMILARILVPEDYGLIAIAMSMYSLLEMLAAFGFDVVLVKKKVVERDDYNSAWTARLLVYTVLAIIFVSSAGLMSEFYNDIRLTPIIYALGFNMILSGLENIALVDFRRELEFDKEFKLQLYIKLFGFFVTIPLAFILQNYWALVIGNVASKLISLILGYVLRPYSPRICFSKIREILNFSKWLLFMNITQFSRKQLPNVLLGKTVSSEAVGIWSICSQLSNDVTQALIASMNRPVYSGFSKLAYSPNLLGRNFLELSGIQILFILPLGFGVSVTSEFVVKVALGSKWLNTIEPLSFMAVAVSVSSVASICQYIYLVKDKPQLTFFLSFIGLAIFAPQAFYYAIGLDYGLMGVVYAHFITCIIMPVINYILVIKILDMSFNEILNNFLRPVFSVLLMYVLLQQCFIPFLTDVLDNSLIKLILCALMGGFVYFASVISLWILQGKPRSTESLVFDMVLTKFSKST